MKEVNLIKDRNERTEIRKRKKKEFDDLCTLSASKDFKPYIKLSVSDNGKYVRLLDEGVVNNANGDSLFYINRGVLKAFYDNLADDYVGSINLGHLDFATFPMLLGQWAKKDLKLVDTKDGRQGLDVKLNLDEKSIFVKELRRQPFTLAVSAEFFFEIDFDKSETMQLEVLKSITIKDFAIVGEPGNVNSDGINLQGGNEIMGNPLEKFLASMKEKKEAKKAEAVETVVEDTATEEVKVEAVTDETKDEAKETGEVELSAEELEEQVVDLISEMSEELNAKDAEIETLKTEIADVKAQLSAKTDRTSEFFKRLSVAATNVEKPVVTEEKSKELIPDDGIGEL